MNTVSDLHCPATLVVARHAKAAFVEDWFSDEGGSLTPAGRAQAHQLAPTPEGRRGSPHTRHVLAVVFMAALLGPEFDYSRIASLEGQWYDGNLDARFEGGESGT